MANEQQQTEKRKREMEGVVVRRSGEKTVSVEVGRMFQHPRYEKGIKRTTRYLAHDPNNELAEGDAVVLREIRPISARKRWMAIKNEE